MKKEQLSNDLKKGVPIPAEVVTAVAVPIIEAVRDAIIGFFAGRKGLKQEVAGLKQVSAIQAVQIADLQKRLGLSEQAIGLLDSRLLAVESAKPAAPVAAEKAAAKGKK